MVLYRRFTRLGLHLHNNIRLTGDIINVGKYCLARQSANTAAVRRSILHHNAKLSSTSKTVHYNSIISLNNHNVPTVSSSFSSARKISSISSFGDLKSRRLDKKESTETDVDEYITYNDDAYQSALTFTPDEIVSHLDKHVVGQIDAKRAIAVAMRARWRRQQLSEDMQNEVTPSNILLIGSTGSGKTEIARRVANLAGAPYVKVEATRYTEVGMIGTNTDTMIKELVEASYKLELKRAKEFYRANAKNHAQNLVTASLRQSRLNQKQILLDNSLPDGTSLTYDLTRSLVESGYFDDSEIQIDLPSTELPPEARPANLNESAEEISIVQTSIGGLGDLNKLLNPNSDRKKKNLKNTKVKDALRIIEESQIYKLIDYDAVKRYAIKHAQENGIVFIDEVDKLARNTDGVQVLTTGGNKGDGVQKELLSLIEGTAVNTPRGSIDTKHMLFIASGAFHNAKPRHLLPELQGRLPLKVELKRLTQAELRRVLSEPQYSILRQHTELFKTEQVILKFTDCGQDAIAHLGERMNTTLDNTGARRLTEIVSRILADDHFDCARIVSQAINDVNSRNQILLDQHQAKIDAIKESFEAPKEAITTEYEEKIKLLDTEYTEMFDAESKRVDAEIAELDTILESDFAAIADIQAQKKLVDDSLAELIDIMKDMNNAENKNEENARKQRELEEDKDKAHQQQEKLARQSETEHEDDNATTNTPDTETMDQQIKLDKIEEENETIDNNISKPIVPIEPTPEEAVEAKMLLINNIELLKSEYSELHSQEILLQRTHQSNIMKKEKILAAAYKKYDEQLAQTEKCKEALLNERDQKIDNMWAQPEYKSPEAPELEKYEGYTIVVDKAYVEKRSANFLEKADLKKFLL